MQLFWYKCVSGEHYKHLDFELGENLRQYCSNVISKKISNTINFLINEEFFIEVCWLGISSCINYFFIILL
jgi:hypothetical protein